ncbi:hypothetical protein ABT275_44925 [Streptomyces sp. NPDC001185]|uniref:hypothetical protein n=1 Tax=Streptomyces sp. NPDC001185 TaxID=3154380 RepID=UPI00331A7D4F
MLDRAPVLTGAAAPFVLVLVPEGGVALRFFGLLTRGDAAGITGSAGQGVSAGNHGAEVLI